MRKNFFFPVGVIALITASGVAYSAYAYQGDSEQRGPNFSGVRYEAMQKAFENNDYNSWKNLMNGRGVSDVINEGNFSRFSEMHRLMLAGKYDEANKIREELGLQQRDNGNGRADKSRRAGNRNCNCPQVNNS
ncbi:MAG: hypothetical protein WC831_03425 [Parcubacteria group bacterium]|jgi:hypothetical protein